MQMRREADSERFRRMIDVRDRANGDLVIPLPDVDGEPTLQPPTPQLILDAIDSTAMQAGSVMPTIFCPPMDPTKTNGIKSMEYAAIRRRALYASWNYNQLDVKLLRFYRHLVGYGTAALMVLPDYRTERARIELRDPLTTYPSMRAPDDITEPENVGFVFGRSRDFLRKQYPGNELLLRWIGSQNEELWDCVEWVDEDEIILGVLGPRFRQQSAWSPAVNVSNRPYAQGLELKRWPNRAGMVPVGVPRRVTLDKIMGQVDTIIGSLDLLTRMSALEVIAAEKAVFPDLQVIGPKGNMPTLVGGEWKDGRTGEANVIIDGEARYLTAPVGPATFQTMANLERAIRLSSGNPEMYGGSLTGSLRSGQTVNALQGIAINPRTQEAHMIAQRTLAVVNKAILAVEKGYWPDKKYTCFGGHGGDSMVEYIPSKHFETLENAVVYPFPGMDLSQITVAVAQMNASGLLSRTTARQQHPLVLDADAEEKRVLVERVDEAALQGFLQMMQANPDPDFYVRLRRHLEDGDALGPAVEKTRDEIAQEQAAAAEQQQAAGAAPAGPPGAPGAPSAEQTPSWAPQPGPANIPGANSDQAKLAQMETLLRAGNKAVPV